MSKLALSEETGMETMFVNKALAVDAQPEYGVYIQKAKYAVICDPMVLDTCNWYVGTWCCVFDAKWKLLYMEPNSRDSEYLTYNGAQRTLRYWYETDLDEVQAYASNEAGGLMAGKIVLYDYRYQNIESNYRPDLNDVFEALTSAYREEDDIPF